MEKILTLLKDPQIWIALGTIVALILSQFPPLRVLLRRARLTVQPFHRIVLYHMVGNANCNLVLILENAGGRTITVDDMTLELSKDGRRAMTLPAQGYWQDFAATIEFPLTRFRLEPGQTWVHTVHWYEEFTRDEERRIAEFRNPIRQDIFEQLQEERAKGLKPDARGHLLVAKDANVEKALEFFQEHFRYEVGEYTATIQVRCSPASAFSPSTYRLTLFESDIDTLRRQKERFKYGEGIYYHQDEERVIAVRLLPG